MIRSPLSIDRDELTYRALFVSSIIFAFLQAFMAVRDMWGHVSFLVTQLSAALG